MRPSPYRGFAVSSQHSPCYRLHLVRHHSFRSMQDVELYAFSKAGYEINISLQPQVMQQKARIV